MTNVRIVNDVLSEIIKYVLKGENEEITSQHLSYFSMKVSLLKENVFSYVLCL